MILGILSGFVAAFFQSCSYLFSKRYVARFEQTTLGLLVCSHVFMGVFSLALLPFLWPETAPRFSHFAVPLAGCVVFYLLGQAFLFVTLKDSDASRVSPLLGLKILLLAALTVMFTNQQFHALQWLAIIIGVCAAYCLGLLGREMTARNWLWILLACLSYSLSDLNIKAIIGRFNGLGLFHASVLCACLCYLFCGAAACIALPFFPRPSFSKWKASFPFALSWFTGILFLFACFGSIGVVFGNIVQSTRGVMSILMGSYVAARGYEHIEEKVTRRATFLRLCAATMMIAAIVLFYSGQK
jgi:drug/metabolite transporter (DMT)-like permease